MGACEEQGPVRLCCGQRHFGPVCKDDRVMCCVCFRRKPISELHTEEDGQKIDVCIPCAQREKEAAEK